MNKHPRFLAVIIILPLILTGCQKNKSSPETAVQQLLDSVEKQDTTKFYTFVDPEVKDQPYSDLVERYFGDVRNELNIEGGFESAEISFQNLTFSVSEVDNSTATVNVTGYITNNRSPGNKILFDKDFSTIAVDGKWVVSFTNPDKALNLVFITHNIQKAPSPQPDLLKWTFFGSIQNAGKETYIGKWPVIGKIQTVDGASYDARVEFFCPSDFIIQTTRIPALLLPPEYHTSGIWGCKLAIVSEVGINSQPKDLIMDNFRISDLTAVRPELAYSINEPLQIRFPDTIELPELVQLSIEGVSTKLNEYEGSYVIDLVLYIQLNNLNSNLAQRIDNVSVSVVGSNGNIISIEVKNCAGSNLPLLSAGPGQTTLNRLCIPLRRDIVYALNLKDGFAFWVYFQDYHLTRVYRLFQISPSLLISEIPISSFDELINNGIVFPGINTDEQVSWDVALAFILYGACQRIEYIDYPSIRLILLDGRILFSTLDDAVDLNTLLSVCGQLCQSVEIVSVVPTQILPPTSRPVIQPTSQKISSTPIPTGWIIVVGAFGEYRKAVNWTDRFIKAGYTTAIYYRQGLNRVVIPGYRTQEEAENALIEVYKINSAAYIRELSTWCKYPLVTANLIECK